MPAIGASPNLTKPQPLTPSASAIMNRPVPIAPTPGSNVPSSIFTHKEWVIPPRPKPGRKPAGDAPPTKRKAQNREAQRAFRERRAAKVGELEEQLRGMEEESHRDNEQLRDRVDQLRYDLEQCREMISTWQRRHEELEVAYRRESQLRQQAEMEINILRSGMTAQTEAVSLPPRRGKRNHLVDQTAPGQELSATANELTCGRCNNSSRCQCIEEAFEIADFTMDGVDPSATKRPHSPSADVHDKRMCQDRAGHREENNEIDFTGQFVGGRLDNTTSIPFASGSALGQAALERCGFCNDGSECICATLTTQPEQQSILAASTIDSVQRADTTKTSNTVSISCTNDPGTCAQCRSDPSSTLFCKTLALTRPKLTIEDSKSTENGDNTQTAPNYPSTALAGPTLTCSDAFSTLSRHHAYSQASTELGSWVSQLTAVPGIAKTEGKTAFEVEAASVMSVLKFFDNRFGEAPQPPASYERSKSKTVGQTGVRPLEEGDLNEKDHNGNGQDRNKP